ncbi:MAG: type IV pilus modification PilV family protein [Phycisphaerales bacterium]
MNPTNRGERRSGFSLIEVLMAVLILALGMLGLGAILPVVVQAQRNGADATFGTLAGQNAQLYLTSNQRTNRGFWTGWANVRNVPEVIPDDTSWKVIPVDQNTGESRPGYNLANLTATTHARLALADRLTPSDSSNGNEPQFVWDMAVRRMQRRFAANQTQPPDVNSLQVAIFIRRIDQRIRVGNNQSLFKMLTDWSASTQDRRWPVSVDSNTGVPTLDGQVGTGFAYSTPMTANVRIVPPTTSTRSDVLHFESQGPLPAGINSMTDARFYELMSQRGQTLVDQLGNVYTVLGPNPDTGPTDIKLTTPIDPYLGGVLNVVFTPQVPATVILMKVTK